MDITVVTKDVCGIDLHAYTMSVCIMDKNGKVLVKKSINYEMGLLMNILKPLLSCAELEMLHVQDTDIL